MSKSPGKKVENELFHLLCLRFGCDCVCHSPTFCKAGGDKELCDILVLALPYAIAFQVKWMKLTAEELTGEKAEIKKERMIRRMRSAADQFSEICSGISHAKFAKLSMTGNGNSACKYTLSMNKIVYLIPIVIIDFEDNDYSDPEKRYCDVPPVITDAGKQAQKYGKIHSFLKADFLRIVDQLFSVGDLMLWLSEREKMFEGMPKALIGYNEMTLFLIYLYNNPLFTKIRTYDGIWIDDNDAYERETAKHKDEFAQRRNVLGRATLIDEIEKLLMCTASKMYLEGGHNEELINYLQHVGRLKRLPSLSRLELSRRLHESLQHYSPVSGKLSFGGTYAMFGEGTISSTLFLLAVCDFVAENVELYFSHAYLKALSYAKKEALSTGMNEVLIVLLRKDRPDISSNLFTVTQADYDGVLTDKELEETRLAFAKGELNTSEWEYVKGICPSTTV